MGSSEGSPWSDVRGTETILAKKKITWLLIAATAKWIAFVTRWENKDRKKNFIFDITLDKTSGRKRSSLL